MANKTPLEKLNARYGVKTETSSSDKMQKQVDNYKTRLKSIGSDYDASDDRNIIEKALNLEKNQNALFDILEIINRPQNALLTGWDYAKSGGSFGEGLLEGIKGTEKTTGKDILMNHYGDWEDREGKIDPVDIAGFGLDLISDPLDWALIPLTGGVSKAAEVGTDVARIASKADNLLDTAQAAKKAYNYSKIDDILGLSKQGIHLASGHELIGKGIGKAIKGTGKLADRAIEGTLGSLDNRTLNAIKKIAGENATADDIAKIAREMGKNPDKLGLYRDLKKGFKDIVDSGSNVGGFIGRSRGYDASKQLDDIFGEKAVGEIRSMAQNIADKTGYSVDDIMEKGVNAVQSNRNWDLTGQDIIRKFKESRNVDFLTKDQANKVKNVLDQFGIKTTLDETGRILNMSTDNLKKLYAIQEAPINTAGKALKKASTKSASFKDFIFGSKNYDEINELLKADRAFFESSPELKELYNTMENAVKTQASLTSDVSKGLNAGEAATTDYVKSSRTDEALRRVPDKEFKAKEAEYDAAIAQVNRMEEEKRLANLAKEEAALDRDLKSIYKTKINENGEEVLVTNSKGEFIRDDNKYKEALKRKNAIVKNIEKSFTSLKEVNNYIKKGTYNIDNLTESGKKAIKQLDKLIDNQINAQNVVNEINDYLKELKELKELTPDSIEAINELKKYSDDFSKLYTELKNKVPKAANKFAKGKGDEIGGLFTADKQMQQLFENVTNAKNKVSEQLTITKAVTNDAYKKGIRGEIADFKKGMEYGDKASKAINKVKDSAKKSELIKTATADNIENLNKKYLYEKQALNNLKDAKDTYYKKTLESIKNHKEQIELLKSQEGQLFFKNKFDETFVDYVKGAAHQNAGTKKFYDALANNLFDNEEYIKVAENGEKAAYGYTKIKGNKLIEKFNAYKPIMTDDGKQLGEILNKFAGKDVIIDKQFATALDVASHTDSSQVRPLLKFWDSLNNKFRKFSTITPGFHMRNIIGNSTDMVLSGVSPAELPSYYKKAAAIWNNADDLVSKARKGLLNEAEAKQFEMLKQFYQGGFGGALTEMFGLDDVAKQVTKNTKNPIDKISRWSINANEKVDSYNRLALLIYANEHPNYVSKLGKASPIDAVKFVLFDPKNISDAEKSFKRVVPFYTFTKQNLMFQANNALKNTGRYSKLYKALRDGYNDLDENSYYEYQKNSMQIPLPFTGSDGNQLFLKANLPVSDLGEFLSSPVQRTVASLSPVIKTPIEMTTGKNLFTGNEANYTTLSGSRASKKLNDTLINMGISTTGITKAEDAADLILNNFGLQNVSTNLVKKVEAILNSADGNTSGQQLWAEIFRSVLQNTKEESVKNSGLYDELEKYQAEIKRLKNQGINVPTIKEMTASNNIKLNNMKRKRANSR